MKKGRPIFYMLLWVALIPWVVNAQDTNISSMLSIERSSVESKNSKVTSVYGISADDYLPFEAPAPQQKKTQVRRGASRPSFDLPDAFYFIGAPIFLLLFLRILANFITDFEEKRKEELRAVSREVRDPK